MGREKTIKFKLGERDQGEDKKSRVASLARGDDVSTIEQKEIGGKCKMFRVVDHQNNHFKVWGPFPVVQ